MFWYIIHGKCGGCTVEFSFYEAILLVLITNKLYNHKIGYTETLIYQTTKQLKKKDYLSFTFCNNWGQRTLFFLPKFCYSSCLIIISQLYHVKNDFNVSWVFYSLSFLPRLWLVISWKLKSKLMISVTFSSCTCFFHWVDCKG